MLSGKKSLLLEYCNQSFGDVSEICIIVFEIKYSFLLYRWRSKKAKKSDFFSWFENQKYRLRLVKFLDKELKTAIG